jgi:ATP-dependent DNA helicase DinG
LWTDVRRSRSSDSRYGSTVRAEERGRPIRKKEKPVVTKPAAPAAVKKELSPWTFTDEEVLAQFPVGKTPRPQQIDAIKQINAAFRAGKRVVGLEMPVGSGKSFVCMTFANAARTLGGTHFATAAKILQRQYERDFPSPAMEVLMGRANYACNHPEAEPGTDAAHGVCRRKNKGILSSCVDESLAPPDLLGGDRSILQRAVALELPAACHSCPYWSQLQRCADHKITLFNFSSFLFQQRIGRFGKRSLMLIDECHTTEGNLMNFVTVELSEWSLSIVNIRLNRQISSKEQFADWLRETDLLRKIDNALKDAKEGDESVPEDLSQVEVEALQELQMKLANFMAYLDKTEWILETVEYKDRRGDPTRKIVARPLFAKHFAEDLLFRHADRVLAMSGTILDARVWAENLGLDPSEVAFVSMDSDFPVENRPIFLRYAGNCSRKTLEETKPKLVAMIKAILSAHSGQRGLIHTQSHELAAFLRREVASPRFLFADQFDGDKEEMLQAHAEREDSVLVSPGMKEGVDLRDELGRFNVVLKMPYASIGDKVVKERMERDPKWYAYKTILDLLQSFGRTTRSKTDWSYTYVLDSGMENLLLRNGSMIPGWVKAAFKRELPKEIRRD